MNPGNIKNKVIAVQAAGGIFPDIDDPVLLTGNNIPSITEVERIESKPYLSKNESKNNHPLNKIELTVAPNPVRYSGKIAVKMPFSDIANFYLTVTSILSDNQSVILTRMVPESSGIG